MPDKRQVITKVTPVQNPAPLSYDSASGVPQVFRNTANWDRPDFNMLKVASRYPSPWSENRSQAQKLPSGNGVPKRGK